MSFQVLTDESTMWITTIFLIDRSAMPLNIFANNSSNDKFIVRIDADYAQLWLYIL
jgi:hypothetical protein